MLRKSRCSCNYWVLSVICTEVKRYAAMGDYPLRIVDHWIVTPDACSLQRSGCCGTLRSPFVLEKNKFWFGWYAYCTSCSKCVLSSIGRQFECVYTIYYMCIYIYIILSIILKTSGESMAFAYLQCVCCNTLEAASIPSVLSEDRRAVIISSETGSGQLSRWCFGWKSTTYFTYFLPREVQHQWTRGYCIKCWMFVEYCSQILMHWRTESWACSLNKTCLL